TLERCLGSSKFAKGRCLGRLDRLGGRYSPNETLWNVREGHSGLMPANLITLPHLSVSSAMKVPNWAGDPGNGAAPKSASRALNLGSANAVLISLLSLSTRSLGALLGALTPPQSLVSKPGTKSLTLATSGRASERVAVETARARNLLALTYSSDEVMAPM